MTHEEFEATPFGQFAVRFAGMFQDRGYTRVTPSDVDIRDLANFSWCMKAFWDVEPIFALTAAREPREMTEADLMGDEA